MQECRTQLAGEEVCLSSARAIFWPVRRTLFVSDVHLGKTATFRAAAIPIPFGITASDLVRLTGLVEHYRPERLVVLGDLLHARKGRCAELFAQVTKWRAGHQQLAIDLVEGNHDCRAGAIPSEWNIRVVTGPVVEGPFVFDHVPDDHTGGYVLAGHLHPKVRLHGAANQQETLHCFLARPGACVLPAFSSFVDGRPVAIRAGERVFAIAGNSVFECPAGPPAVPLAKRRWGGRGSFSSRRSAS